MRRAILIVLGALLVLRAFATFSPTPWLWGLDSLSDAPVGLRPAGLLLFLLVLLPPVWGRALPALALLRSRLPARWAAVLGLAVALVLLGTLRIEHNLLGDAQTWVSSLQKGIRSAGGAHREPLPQGLVAGAYAAVGPLLGPNGTFAAVGLVLALGYLTIGWLLARRLSSTTEGRVLLYSCAFLGGGLQLYSGYAEFYNFAVVAALLFAWLGLRWIGGRGRLVAATLAYILAGLCHAQMVFAAPALLVLVAAAWRRGERREALLSLLAVPVVTGLVLLALRYPFGEIGRQAIRPDSFLPPLGHHTGQTAYSVIAWPHFAELLNAFLLIAPGLPVALVMALRAPARPGVERSFLAALAIGPLVFALIANPALGMIRDWDIFVLPVTLAALWAASWAAWALEAGGRTRLPPGARSGGRPAEETASTPALHGSAVLVAAVAGTCLLHAVFWLEANHKPAWALERVRRVASNEAFFGEKSLGEAWRYVGSADLMAGRAGPASESYLQAIAADPDERMTYRLLAGVDIERALRAGATLEAGLALYDSTLSGQKHRPAYVHYGACFAALLAGREEIALIEAAKASVEEPRNPEILATFGDFLRRAGRDNEARSVYERALARDPAQPRARIGLACLAGIRGDRAEMERYARDAVRDTPWSPQAQQFLGLLSTPDALTPEGCRKHLYIR